MHADPRQFDPAVPIERASTPPASWYTDPMFLALERDRVFRRSWQPAGRLEQLVEAVRVVGLDVFYPGGIS